MQALRQAFEAEVLLRLLVSYRTLARAHFLPAAPLTYPICRVERPAEYGPVLMARDESLANRYNHVIANKMNQILIMLLIYGPRPAPGPGRARFQMVELRRTKREDGIG